jgi:hypothetical protein
MAFHIRCGPGKARCRPLQNFAKGVARVQRLRLSEDRLANHFESAMVDAA